MLPGEKASSGRNTHSYSNMSRSSNIPRHPFIPPPDQSQLSRRSYRLPSTTSEPSSSLPSNQINSHLKSQQQHDRQRRHSSHLNIQKPQKVNHYNGGDPFSACNQTFTNVSNSTTSPKVENPFVSSNRSEKPHLNVSRFESISSTAKNGYSVEKRKEEIASEALKTLGNLNNDISYSSPNSNPHPYPTHSSLRNNIRNFKSNPSSPGRRDSCTPISHSISYPEHSHATQSSLVIRRNIHIFPNTTAPINVDEDQSTANHTLKPPLRPLTLYNANTKSQLSIKRSETNGVSTTSQRPDADEVKLVNASPRPLETTLRKESSTLDEPCDIESIPIPRKTTNNDARITSSPVFYQNERPKNISTANPNKDGKESGETQIVLVDERDSDDEHMNTERSPSGTSAKQSDQSVAKSVEKSDLKETNVNNGTKDTHTIDLSEASPNPKQSRPFSRSQYGSANNSRQNTNSNCTIQAKGTMKGNESLLTSSTERRRTMKEGRTDRMKHSESPPAVKKKFTLRSQVVAEKNRATIPNSNRNQKRQRPNSNLRYCNMGKVKENENERKKFCDTKDWERIVFNETYFDKVVSEFVTSHPTLIALPFFGLTNQEVRSLFERLSKLVQDDGVKQLDLNNNRIYNLSKDIYQHITALKVFSWNMSCNRISNIPSGISLCCTLRILNISRNTISSVSQEIGELCNLEVLNLAHNKLTMLPGELYRLQKLEILNLSHNYLKELPEDIASEGSKLTSLDLSFNESFEKFPKCAGHWKHIVDLLLVGTHCFSTLSRKDLRLGEQKLLQNLVQRATPSTDDPDSIDVQYVK